MIVWSEMPFFRVRGQVTAKRKRADGHVHYSVQCSSIVEVDENDHVSNTQLAEDCTSRCVQLVQNSSTKLLPHYIADAAVMSLASSQSIVEGFGKQQERAGDQRMTIDLASIQVHRIATNPLQIKLVLELAYQDDVKNSKLSLDFLNSVISPFVCAEDTMPGHNYLQSLLSNELSVKSHCHFLTDYSASGSRSVTRKDKITNFRSPRRRVRKVTAEEKAVVDALHQQAQDRLRMTQQLHNINIECDEVEQETDYMYHVDSEGLSRCTEDEGKESSVETCLLNVPDNSSSLKSRRGALTRGEYIHGKKEPQVEWIVRRLFQLIDGSSEGVVNAVKKTIRDELVQEEEELNIMDVGGGRGDLAVGIALELRRRGRRNGKVYVVDLNGKSLAAGQVYAEQLGVSDLVVFLDMDFSEVLGNIPNTSLPACHYVVALHACGSLSDMALSYASQRKASFCVVPCCFSKTNPEHSSSMWCATVAESSAPPTTSPQLEDSTMQILPETTQPHGSREDRIRMLGRLAESEPRECSWKTMRGINILRLCGVCSADDACILSIPPSYETHNDDTVALVRAEENGKADAGMWQMTLDSFPRAYSLRNMVLIGSLRTSKKNSVSIKQDDAEY
jgi:hypothetical protein